MTGGEADTPTAGANRNDGLTQSRWDHLWTAFDESDLDPNQNPQVRDSLALIRRFWPAPRTGSFLEAGCGPAANALQLAKEGASVAGVDYTTTAIDMARAIFRRHGAQGHFTLGDIRALPFPDGEFDFVYAGGVVEHFVETIDAIREMRRCTRTGGRVLLTVPALTLSYPYLFIRGNVPAIPIAEPLVAFVHFKLLSGKLATYGYERSFTRSRLRTLMRSSGLRDVQVGGFDTYLPLASLPAPLREPGRRLARTPAFCPMYWAVGVR